MRNELLLYHFFPRQAQSAQTGLGILKSILNNGIYLTNERVVVPWPDNYNKGVQKELNINQYRFCLTAILNKNELIEHCKVFGNIGLEFDVNFVIGLGGFPVFYVPTPNLVDNKIIEGSQIGISLLHRLAEAREILEYANLKIKKFPDIDIENVLGAIRFLGNIFYPTARMTNNLEKKILYYYQHEWRIIYGLSTGNVVTKEILYNGNIAYMIEKFQGKLVSHFIRKVYIYNSMPKNDKMWIDRSEIEKIIKQKKLNIDVELLED